MNQVDDNRKFSNVDDLLHWSIYMAWLDRGNEVSIVPIQPIDNSPQWQSFNVYVNRGGKAQRFDNRSRSGKTRYTASVYVYAQ